MRIAHPTTTGFTIALVIHSVDYYSFVGFHLIATGRGNSIAFLIQSVDLLQLGFTAFNPTYRLESFSLTERYPLRKMVLAIYKEIGFFAAMFKTIFHDVFN